MKPKTQKVLLYIFLVVVSVMIGFGAGFQKLIYTEQLARNMAAIHFGEMATRLIGLAEVLAVVGMWFFRFRTAAIVALYPILFGAVAAHLGAGQPLQEVILSIVCIVLITILLFLHNWNGVTYFLTQRDKL